MKKLVYINHLDLSPIQKFMMGMPFSRKLELHTQRVLMMNYQLWETAVITALMSLKKEMLKKRKSKTFQMTKVQKFDGYKKKIEIIMSDEEWDSVKEKLIPHFKSYDEFKRLQENAIRRARNLSMQVRKIMGLAKEKEFKEALKSYEEYKLVTDNLADKELKSRNGYWLFFTSMISIHLYNILEDGKLVEVD